MCEVHLQEGVGVEMWCLTAKRKKKKNSNDNNKTHTNRSLRDSPCCWCSVTRIVPLTVIMKGTALIISRMKGTRSTCSQTLPWKHKPQTGVRELYCHGDLGGLPHNSAGCRNKTEGGIDQRFAPQNRSRWMYEAYITPLCPLREEAAFLSFH